ncbi:hypothetical protein TIFTF001_052150, partial [Ficus carica]
MWTESIADAEKRKQVRHTVTIVISTVSGFLLIGIIAWYIFRSRKTKRQKEKTHDPYEYYHQETQEGELELPLFDLDIISLATDKFSFANKIREGGFGHVYKELGQGIQEFMNEVILIAKLQHCNLVRLLGCCIQGEERMLVYEYLPNKSLNSILFDQTRKKLLPWRKRFDIIMAIARGLLYLHQDSRLRIIHRDLKASNILLDIEMNPKISDFGIARIFGGEQTQERTRRVMGTYGYMSPECSMSGQFSVKSAVFSFGVLVLDIVSGERNWDSIILIMISTFLDAWKLWNEEKPLELMDAQMVGSFSANEVIRCVKSMGTVVKLVPAMPMSLRWVGKALVLIAECLGSSHHHRVGRADDTTRPNQTLLDTGQTLVSFGETFELGFFSPPNSNNRYVGIWFKNVANRTVVWVANRDRPLTDSSGIFKITETGNIVILNNKTENPLWASNSSAKDPTLQLLSTGNLVVEDGSSKNYAWQSFDHPCETLIAG